MIERLKLLLRRAVYNMRGGFLVRPLTIALVLGLVGALLSWMEEEVPGVSGWVPTVLFPTHTDPQVVQVILAGIAASIMTVVSIVFAILLMTLTLASMQFSPRIILSFTRDRVTQWTLGIFLGTFSYCMAALPAARSMPTPFAPVVTVLGAMLLALTCVGWLLFFIHHISQAISGSLRSGGRPDHDGVQGRPAACGRKRRTPCCIRYGAVEDLAAGCRVRRPAAPALRRTLAERGRRIVAGCAEKLSDEELREIRARSGALERLFAGERSAAEVVSR